MTSIDLKIVNNLRIHAVVATLNSIPEINLTLKKSVNDH